MRLCMGSLHNWVPALNKSCKVNEDDVGGRVRLQKQKNCPRLELGQFSSEFWQPVGTYLPILRNSLDLLLSFGIVVGERERHDYVAYFLGLSASKVSWDAN